MFSPLLQIFAIAIQTTFYKYNSLRTDKICTMIYLVVLNRIADILENYLSMHLSYGHIIW